ncbi:Protein FAR1-RELATED SEQUENCE 5 [Fagus crenata]
MEEEPSSESKELVDSFAALEEDVDECCVVEDVETPMVLDDASEHNVNMEYSECLELDPSKSLSNSFSSPGMGLNDPINVLTDDSNSFGKLVFTVQNSVNYIGRGRLSTFGMDAQSLLGFFKSETPDEFESSWLVLLDKYNLRGNEWLQSLYIDRKLWVPTYVRDTFFAGMYATQRSTSVYSLFDGYVNARTTLQDFAEQYEKALDDRYEKEARAEFETFYTKPVLKTPLPMEKQAAEIYTRKFFTIFQEEVFESLALAVKFSGEDGGSGTYEARGETQGNSQKGKNLQYNILYQEAIKCADEGMTSDHSFRLALNALREARIKIIDAKKDAINAKKMETMASTSYQDENTTIASQVDSSSAPVTPLEYQKTKTRESSRENNILSSEQSSSRVMLCTSCKCPGHDSSTCLWLKDSGQNTSMDDQNQKIVDTTSPCR